MGETELAVETRRSLLEKQIIDIKLELADASSEDDEQILLAKQYQNETAQLREKLDKLLRQEKQSSKMVNEVTEKASQLEQKLEQLTKEVEYMRKETHTETTEKSMLLERLNSSRGIPGHPLGQATPGDTVSPMYSYDTED
uniref:Uncharacterized protein n=1 Tax=Helicotheca tamesis TaxID=374047 RepID=A0A7S2IHX7_9STRA